MSRYYQKTPCVLCGQRVSNNGFPATSHKRKHVREGLMYEYVERCPITGYRFCGFDLTEAGKTRLAERNAAAEVSDAQ